MSTVVRISGELGTWISHNLDRGCAPRDLIETMVRERFEPRIARALLDAFVGARTEGRPAPQGEVALELTTPAYEYERLRLAPGNCIRAGGRDIPVLMRLAQPAMAILGEVLSPLECEELIELARGRLRPSTVVDPSSGVDRIADYRSSEGMFFRLRETALVAKLDERLAELMSVPVEHGEGLQVLRYAPGAASAPHFDFLLPSNPANQSSLARSGQRTASLVVYLNDVSAGGETLFPEVGLAVCARRGQAVYFEYANRRGQLDYRSLHAGGSVAAGEKWAATKWVRERPFVSA